MHIGFVVDAGAAPQLRTREGRVGVSDEGARSNAWSRGVSGAVKNTRVHVTRHRPESGAPIPCHRVHRGLALAITLKEDPRGGGRLRLPPTSGDP